MVVQSPLVSRKVFSILLYIPHPVSHNIAAKSNIPKSAGAMNSKCFICPIIREFCVINLTQTSIKLISGS
jgi:hypothetical protein